MQNGLKPLAEAVQEYLGRRVSAATLQRWITRGVRGRVLRATLVGGRWYTSPEALREFALERPAIAAEGGAK